MRLEVKRVAVVIRESGSEKSKEAAAKLQRLLIGQGNALWNRHFQTSLSEDGPFTARRTFSSGSQAQVPRAVHEQESTHARISARSKTGYDTSSTVPLTLDRNYVMLHGVRNLVDTRIVGDVVYKSGCVRNSVLGERARHGRSTE